MKYRIMAIATCALATPVALAQNLVKNGSFNTDDNSLYGTWNNKLGTQLNDWSSVSIETGEETSTDIFDRSISEYQVKWESSRDGGSFLHGYSTWSDNDSLPHFECITQTITGLTIGKSYMLSFEQSISAMAGYFSFHSDPGAIGYWSVQIGDQSFDASSMVTPDFGSSYAWELQTHPFTATSTSMDLSFTAMPTDLRQYTTVDLGLDGVSVVLVPEPSAAALVSLAGAVILLMRRCRMNNE